jgi:hypothetical protein
LIDGNHKGALGRGVDRIDHSTTHTPAGADNSYANSHRLI